jgi:TolB-like protein
MADQSIQRRLAAILAADVAGYTRLMEEDSEGTVAAWQDARETVIKTEVASHSGKIVKLTGDGFLVEFPTVQDAVNCAIAMQGGLTSSSLDFRMGVNLGDIIDDGEDIHGEGVNIAARLEGLAEPGGIVISGDVHNQVRNRIDAEYEDMGPQEVKNVSAPVQAYALKLEFGTDSRRNEASHIEKPSIAILPFDNLSGDPEQEYFSDGITEDIITALSRIRQFLVIARNTTFTYKDQAVDVGAVARELGVRYVLEGSVRKSGERVRITAQLIDGETGNHLWAEKYDRNLEDIFEVQDEITQVVSSAIEPEITKAEFARAQSKQPDDLDAWGQFQKGKYHFYRANEADLDIARQLVRGSIRKAPRFQPSACVFVQNL